MFNTKNSIFCPHYVLAFLLRKKNSDFFPIRHSSIGLSNEMCFLRGTICIFIHNIYEFSLQSVHWLRRSVTCVSPGRPGFYSGTTCEIYSGQCGIRIGFPPEYFTFFPVSILQRVLHTHLHLHFAFTRRTRGPSL